MKRLLFVSSRVPYPLIGGDKIRIFNSLKSLSKEYEVDLLYITDENPTSDSKCILKEICNDVFEFKVSKIKYYINTIMGIVYNKKPLQVNYYYFKDVASWINKNINNYDLVYCNHIRTTEYVVDCKIMKVVDFVDSISMNYNKAYNTSKGLWRIIYWIEKQRIKKYEVLIAKKFDKSIIISEVDKNYIDPNNIYDINIIGNYVSDLKYDNNIILDINNICFLGKMDYEPNISAVLFFVKNVYVKIHKNNDNLKFKIIGVKPTKEILKLCNYRGVEITGYVENPYNIIQNSIIFVAPMISGAGVQNKILEAMMMEKCVVTTIIGAEGLKNISDDEIVICRNVNDMINKIEFLISNPNKAIEIGRNAKKYIVKNYDKEIIEDKLVNVIRELFFL